MVHPVSMERITMRILFAVSVLMACATAAQASVQVKAVPEGNVVEFDVLAVTAPASLPGYCAVTALTGKVWQGTAFHPGQPLFLSVPCAQYGLIPAHAAIADGPAPVQVRSLQESRHGIARLSDNGELLWQDAGGRNYGPWGEVAGYRVLDARMLPLTQS
jgi:hypothetical protein